MDGVDGLIRFAPGNAEALPFADASFDCIFSVTVLEECDADRALALAREIIDLYTPAFSSGASPATDVE